MLEQQIYSIESANINQETLVAMKNAGKAMKEIHGKMTMEDVDTTMYISFSPHIALSIIPVEALLILISYREQLREQHELTQEIGNAITSMPITEPIDEDELEADLAALEQENLDEKMLKTGTVPVADSLSRMPKAANGESKCKPSFVQELYADVDIVGGKKKAAVEEDDEEEELRKLQAEMAI